ncbi:rhodanese-like domain-containing protein [Fictibacillus nanhaiensis]|uniref:Rhodanese-like domain-containing protein n=3 Tax=Bacteria TaxID=2 RepID=A0A160INP1_9BACL|nr:MULTISPECIES: rhodanese-like domain-containing protein [Bacillaceae]ANC77834.1 rhodanese-like domain-containing protein [Fictibacillus phosphorivorans]MBN3556096.1 rhodanese-like domain-containing protein [Fictibacillus nanhaiensis]MQR95617.1 rhodanese-like domain-containing protein [Fictibacillus phosphorivorans]
MGWIVLAGIVVALLAYVIGMGLYQKRFLTTLNEEEFKAGYRKAQLIDVREPEEFKKGHILGARNIPLSQMRQRLKEVRSDQPVYLYCESGFRSARAANFLKKKKYGQLHHLNGGFRKWTGRVKSN